MVSHVYRGLLAAVFAATCAVVLSIGAFAGTAHAATSAVYTASTVPSYSNPVTGEIEDSAGQSNVALAESMTTGCTYSAALVEKDTAGNTFVTLRIKLADQIGAMNFWVDDSGDGAFAAVEAVQMQADSSENTADWRFQIPSELSNIRVGMYVNPMGREVVYFTQLANLVEGNTDAAPFVQTVTPGEQAAEPAPAAEPAASAASGSTTSNASGAPNASNASSSSTSSSDASPSTEGSANSGVKEYNADGQETTEGQSQAKPLDGATTGAIVAGIVVVLVVAGVVAYFAYLKPKRAEQAEAAKAAAAAAKPQDK